MKYLFWQWPDAISTEKCNQIIELGTSLSLEQAKVTMDAETAEKSLRSSKIAWINDIEIKNMLHNFAFEINKKAFNFDIYEKPDHFDVQFTEYDSFYNGHYNWHVDTFLENPNFNDRKISLTLQLSDGGSDYEGGDFYFNNGDEIMIDQSLKKKGTLIAFPSFLLHKVSPVTKGTRRSLVAWIEGPNFK
jgi:PKHD-type hydroxylase